MRLKYRAFPAHARCCLHSSGLHQIAQINDVKRGWNPESGVVQAWPQAIGEGNVMHAALTVGPCSPKFAALLISRIFGYAEAKLIIKATLSSTDEEKQLK